jgi:hypothetical protein
VDALAGGRWRPGPSLTSDQAKLLGYATAVGVDPVALLRSDAITVQAVLDSMQHASEWIEARDDALARRIINTLGEAWKK